MSQLSKSYALVLNSIRWQESSKIIGLYSREWGKLKVIAKGALRKNSPFAGKLESLNLLEVIVSHKDSRELQILTECDFVNAFSKLRLQLDKLPFALAILEIIQKSLAEHHADPQFFDFVAVQLEQMETGNNPQTVFLYFLIKFASYMGFKPNFTECQSCSEKMLKEPIYFSAEQGVIYCSKCALGSHISQKISSTERDLLLQLQTFPHRRIATLIDTKCSTDHLLQVFLDYINFHLDQQLNLRSLVMLMP